jgi:hypothetical protein
MSFLQPAALLAIPVIALPIIIHLINQRRFQTVQWAAMQFLLAANRMSRGYARIRQWLILAARTIAVAGLVFAISRPLSSGWLGLAGGSQVDTTIILLDRSPSMMQRGPGGVSKLQSGLEQLAVSLGMLRSSRYVLIDSAGMEPVEIDTPELLTTLPETMAVSESADVPAMLEVADEYIRANRPSRSEVWICSDVRKNDWKDESGRWNAVRNSLLELPQMVRFHLLAYPDVTPPNRSIQVTSVRRVDGPDGPQLLLSLRVAQTNPVDASVTIPIQLELDGARSEFTAEMVGSELELRNYAVPIDRGQTRGWGRVTIASDASPADNEYYFVYDEEVERQTLIVADDPSSVQPLEFAAAVSPDPEITCTSETLTRDQFVGASLENVSLLIWQSVLPSSDDPESGILQDFVGRGGQVVFFPPESPAGEEFAGLQWGEWQEHPNTSIATWVGDDGLLSNTRSGASLPVGELKVSRYCELQGDHSALATLDGGAPLLVRALTDQRNVYFCCTTTTSTDSSLAQGGVVLYVMIQRALEAGATSLGNTRQLIAGAVPDHLLESSNWRQEAGNPDALSNAYSRHAGVYRVDEQLIAINRSENEDIASIVSDERVTSLFDRLEFDRVDDQAGSGVSLIQEIWRLFLILMLCALVLEAVLCIPRRVAAATASRGERVAV